MALCLSALAGCGSHGQATVDASGRDGSVEGGAAGDGPAQDRAGPDGSVDGRSADAATVDGGWGDRGEVGPVDLGMVDLSGSDVGGDAAAGQDEGAGDVAGKDAPVGQDEGAGDVGDDASSIDGAVPGVDGGGAPDAGFSVLDAGSDVAGVEVASCTLSPFEDKPDAGPPLPDNVQFVPGVAVTTVAGGPSPGTADGALGIGLLSNPVSVAIEPGGALLVADFDTDRLRRVAVDGTISTLTVQTTFERPFGLAFANGALYAQTDANPDGESDPTTGTLWRVDRSSGAAAVVAANLGRPRAFAALSDGRLVLSDGSNQHVSLIDLSTGVTTNLAGLAGCPGSANGTGAWARFSNPQGIVVISGNRIVVADREARRLREISLAGVVTTFAGDGIAGTVDGPRASARFVAPQALAADNSGAVFVSDADAHRIRRIASDGTVTTVAGDGTAGFADGSGALAKFFGQEGLAVSADGKTIYVADGTGGSDTPVPYHRVRKIAIGP